MKILHLCLGNFYIDGYSYQENIIPRLNKAHGNEVLIIASTETYIDNQRLGYVLPSDSYTEYGVRIKRIPYRYIITDFITHKVRAYQRLYSLIEEFDPDVIMSHGLCYWSVKDVVKYIKRHPSVKLYADTHTAEYNSGKNWVSLNILHRLFYKHLIQNALPYVRKYFYIGESERIFSKANYDVPDDKMEYYPLGGLLLNQQEYNAIRKERREELGVCEDERLYIHSGKLDIHKKTAELIRAFAKVGDSKSKLVIIGSIPDDQKKIIEPLVAETPQVIFLGWKTGEELQEYLCACDMYCQPGSPSATMQNAICRNCAIMAFPYEAFKKHLDWDNILWVRNDEDIRRAFESIAMNPNQLDRLKINSSICAKEILDYEKLAARLYE